MGKLLREKLAAYQQALDHPVRGRSEDVEWDRHKKQRALIEQLAADVERVEVALRAKADAST